MSVQRLWILAVGCLLVLSSSCGKEPVEKDNCAGVVCELGVCDAASGSCQNPGTCDDANVCLAGYACESGACVATVACGDDAPCERGVCESGACVNSETCEADTDCVAGSACADGVCLADACADVTCDRGVCERSTGECVNATVCTPETQESACLDGFVCYDQACAAVETVCEAIDCERGACDTATLGCINATDCAGSDLGCLEGYVCGADDTCIENVCDADMVNCTRGVCEEATGECLNAETCDALSDCTDGFYCVDSACTEIDVACEVCSGNQVCSYDETLVDVVCSENPEGCVTTVDCIGENVCDGGACGEAQACVADAQEPNDASAEATDWFATAIDGGITASLCDGEADFYSYDLAQDPEFTGTLVAQVVIETSDIGIGAVTLDLHGPDGTVVATSTSNIEDASVRVEYAVGNIDQGVYTLVVRDAGVAGIGGVDYTVYVDLLDPIAATTCAAAQLAVTGAMGDTSLSQSNTLGSSCTSFPEGTEEAWVLNVPVRSYVTIDVTGVQFDALISLRQQCEVDASEIACVNNGGARVRETLRRTLEPGPYSLLVQGADGAQSGAYGLQIQQDPIICTSAEDSCSDPTTSIVCNGRGTAFETETCAAGCDAATGRCIREPADVCATAIDATNGFTGTIATSPLLGDYDPGTSCVPEDTFGSVTAGPDAVFAVSLQPGESLYATADPDGYDYIGMYLVEDCGDVATSCVLGVNDGSYSATETLVYENATAGQLDYFLVVDSEAGTTSDIAVNIETGARICTPGTVQCNGSAMETCTDSGLSFASKTCSNGCDPVELRCIPPANDVCGGAIDVSGGGQWVGPIDEYTGDIDNDSNCTGDSSAGPDAMYVITGTPGQIATVSVAAPFDASLYASTDCADAAFTCRVGDDDGTAGDTESIELRFDDTQPIYIFVDTYDTDAQGQFTLDVSLRAAACTNYEEAVGCSLDGTTLQICNEVGVVEDYACETTCAGLMCDRPRADRCADALTLVDGQTFSGSFDDLAPDYDPLPGTCILASADRQDGPDATFAIDLVAGDLLTASLTSSSTLAGMWVMTDCASTRDSCLKAAPRSEKLLFFAQTSGRYYLVVDSTFQSTTASFTVGIDIQSGFACEPGGTSCDPATGLLTTCDDTGMGATGTVSCPNGCRTSGHCIGGSPAPDVCGDATVVTAPISFLDNYGRFTNTFDPGAITNACGLTDTDGPDAIYEVTLAVGEVLDVTVDDLGGTGTPGVYIATDCADVATSCLASGTDAAVVRATHVSSTGGPAWIVVDNESTSATDPFSVEIDMYPAECTPGTTACTGPNTLESCNEFAKLVTSDCYFGCVAGACAPPTNDTCATPVDVTGGGTFSLEIDGYAADYDPAGYACTGYAAEGADAVFKLSMAQGEVAEITAGSEDFDISVYLTSTCGDVTTCMAGLDYGYRGDETIVFSAPAAGDYYIHVDTWSTSATGDFGLTVDYLPVICTASAMTCDVTGQSIEVCNAYGTAEDPLACDTAGCVPGAEFCTTRDGEVCVQAIDANARGTFTGTFADYVNDYSLPPFASCTGWDSAGPEAVYYVDLLAGQTLTATLSSTSDTSLWFSTSCRGATESCVAGDDVVSGAETVTYTAAGDERIFIFADNYSSSATDPYTLTVAIQ